MRSAVPETPPFVQLSRLLLDAADTLCRASMQLDWPRAADEPRTLFLGEQCDELGFRLAQLAVDGLHAVNAPGKPRHEFRREAAESALERWIACNGGRDMPAWALTALPLWIAPELCGSEKAAQGRAEGDLPTIPLSADAAGDRLSALLDAALPAAEASAWGARGSLSCEGVATLLRVTRLLVSTVGSLALYRLEAPGDLRKAPGQLAPILAEADSLVLAFSAALRAGPTAWGPSLASQLSYS